jgi:hypothetical protein
VFDNTGHNDAANFQRSLKGLANHLHTTYSAEVAEAILKMQAVTINVEDQPPIKMDPTTNLPVPLASWEEYKWRQEYTEQSKKLKLYNDSMPKAYIQLYNQCSTNLKNDLEASTAFPHVEASKDAIGLLKLIQGLCCSYDSKTQSVMATVASQKKLFTFFQRDGMDSSSYHVNSLRTSKPSKPTVAWVRLELLQLSLPRNFTKCTHRSCALIQRSLLIRSWLLPTRTFAMNSSLP